MAGYSEKTAYSIGTENLKKPEIAEYIQIRLKKLEDARTADASEVLKYLTSVMRREHCENVVVTLTQEKSTYAPDEKGTMRKQMVKQEIPQIIEIPAKLSDANKAAELLGKRFGLWKESTQDGDEGVQIIDDI